MGRIIRFNPDRHEEAQTLLPWYVTGRLEEDERARIEAHLRDCAECQAELRLERQLAGELVDLPVDTDHGWNQMRRRIDAQARSRRPLARLGRLLDGPVAGWALAAQFVLVIVGVAFVAPAAHPPRYQALAAARPTPAGDVLVIFRPEAKAEDLARALHQSGARLVDGPTAADAYLLAAPAGRRAETLARLRLDAAVTFAQPIDPTPRP